jgi:endonuclease/exonuclease/phosphatase family metal-dependent hydrolase
MVMNLTVRRCADRAGSSVVLLLAAVACALVLALSGCNESSGTSGSLAREPSTSTGKPAAVPPAGSSTYTLMQMNLCLSGLAGCYGKAAYPAVVEEAVARIREAHPDAVTFNEACRSDIARIGRRTGYHLRFSRVIYRGERLRCVRPGDRGLFGEAVLTEAAIERTVSQDFEAQAGIERRRWLCVTTRVDVDVCTAHLNTRSTIEVAGNDAQCVELAALLARRATARTVIFGGDVNRRHSCAPAGVWTRTDRSAEQAPGLQHVYGSGALRSPSAEVVPATHSDHDVLLVRAHLGAG